MSAWRRIAIAKVPGCKKLIEEEKHEVFMWSRLAELLYFKEVDEQTAHDIHRFAFECLELCGKKLKHGLMPHLMYGEIWAFYEYFLSSPEAKEQLKRYYSAPEVNILRKSYPDEFPSDFHF
jgi:hypothetical protein